MDRKFVGVSTWEQSNYAYEFEEFESIPTKTNYNFIHIFPHPRVYEELDDLVVFQIELPNCLISGDINKIDVFKYNDKVKKIITNCPFSVKYFNKLMNYDKFIFGFSPFNPKYIPLDKEKIYDVFHTGHLHNSIIYDIFPIIEKFNACFVCADYGKHKNVGYKEKLKLNAQSKISIVHGLLKWPDQFKDGAAKFVNHGAFELVKEYGIVPQMKTRIMEAAASKSLILCLQDPWNLIESYFEETVDFIYWKNAQDLEDKIKHILSHYDDYQHIIENAYNTLMNNYTPKHFFDLYLKNL
jgi:hypothetical protein